jgi:hypothetical protein
MPRWLFRSGVCLTHSTQHLWHKVSRLNLMEFLTVFGAALTVHSNTLQIQKNTRCNLPSNRVRVRRVYQQKVGPTQPEGRSGTGKYCDGA